jgi:formylglycine-generating enzyme required for sulfatase activity
MIIAGSALAAVLLILMTGLWIRSGYKAEAARKAAADRADSVILLWMADIKAEADGVAADRESARLADIKAEADRVAADRESARLADIKAEADRLAADRESARLADIKAEADRLAAERVAAEKAAADKAAKEKAAAEKVEMEEKAAADKAAADKAATDKAATERTAAVKKQMTPAQLALGDLVVNSVGMLLVPIPAGEFQMGSPDAAIYYDGERAKPQHLVKITKPFYLGVYEVTQQQYEKVMGARPWRGDDYVKEGADYPASYVTRDRAVEFCRRLSKQEGVEYRLPTEAEWEYACRAGTTTAYSFGDDRAKLGQYAWYEKNAWDIGEKYAHGVGQKLPNRWGLYDMHGNVWEWCQDWYGPYGSDKVVSDPVGPAQGDRRVLRGGSFNAHSSLVRSAYRNYLQPGYPYYLSGFRAARTYHVSP